MTETRSGLLVLGFLSPTAFEIWLTGQEPDAAGLWIKFAKKGAANVTLTKAEAIDVALCHGWIDGQIQPYDDQFWLVRFTPRKPRSKWSVNNRKRALELSDGGRMRPAGAAQIEAAKADGRWEGAYAGSSASEVPDDLQAALDSSPSAAAFFATLSRVNRYAVLYRIGAAKRAETRARKIAGYITMLERGETIHP